MFLPLPYISKIAPTIRQRLSDWMEETPPFQRSVFWVSMSSLILILGYTFIVMPKSRELEAVKEKKATLVQQVLEDQVTSSRWETLMGDTRRLETETLQEEQGLGLNHGLEGVFQKIADTAKRLHIAIMLWRPKEIVQDPSGYLKQIPVELEIEGTYHQVALFVDHIRELPKILTVSGMTMEVVPDPDEQSLVRASLELIGHEPAPLSLKEKVMTPPSAVMDGSLTTVDALHYAPGIRRDPFVPLTSSAAEKDDQAEEIKERNAHFKLLGIISGKSGFHALLTAKDGESQFVHVGSKLEHDRGVVKEITDASVVIQKRKTAGNGSSRLIENVISFGPVVQSK